MSRYRFAPASPRSQMAHAPRSRRVARAGDVVEIDDCYAAYILGAYPGAEGGPSLIPLDDPRDAVADGEIPALPDSPEAVAPLDIPVPLAEAFAPPVSEPEPVWTGPHVGPAPDAVVLPHVGPAPEPVPLAAPAPKPPASLPPAPKPKKRGRGR